MNAKPSTSRVAALPSRIAACFLTAAIAFCCASASSAAAESDYEFTFTAGAWWTRVNAEVTLGAGNPTLLIEEAFNLDQHEFAFAAEFAVLKRDQWRLELGGFHFSADSSGEFGGTAQFGSLPLTPGQPFDASIDLTSIAAEFTVYPWQPYCIGPDCRVALRAGPTMGIRHIKLDHDVTAAGLGAESAGGEWLAPFAGMRLELRYETPDCFPLIRLLQIDGSAALGPALGGDGGIMAQLHTGFTFFFTPNFGLGIGYRLLELSVENDEYEFVGGLQGLIFSGTVRF